MKLKAIKWEEGKLLLINQNKLPNKIEYHENITIEDTFKSIRTMIVRGAPAIGVAAAYGMVLGAKEIDETNTEGFLKRLSKQGEYLKTSRPTAVNLKWAVDKMLDIANKFKNDYVVNIKEKLEEEAIRIHEEDIAINKQIGVNLLSLLKDGDTVLTHCNAGSLATSGYGTALSVFYVAKEQGINLKVYADETRPRLQGAKLTAFELQESGVDVTLITDNMAAQVMKEGKIDAVIVGCDRVASNGDTANKIGTLGVSILAKYYKIPVYIATPTPTIDMNCETGDDIPIEERDSKEITQINGEHIAPKGVKTYNPAFDVTPAELIAAIITEKGIVKAPYKESFERLFKN